MAPVSYRITPKILIYSTDPLHLSTESKSMTGDSRANRLAAAEQNSDA